MLGRRSQNASAECGQDTMLAVRRKRVKMNALARKLTNEISRVKGNSASIAESGRRAGFRLRCFFLAIFWR